MKKEKVIITYGTYDMFHIGHLNILKRAKALGDILIVGVTSEDYDRSRGKLNVVQDLDTRIKSIEALDFIDKVIIEEHQHQKEIDIQKYNVDTFVLGDDWVGKFDYLEEYCDVVYLARTKGISSTSLRKEIKKIKLGIIGTGRIATRFSKESSFVDSIDIKSVFSLSKVSVENFLYKHGILYGFTDINQFLLSDIDAVYIASPHQFHYQQIKSSLNAGKHVLCEKPIVLEKKQLLELLTLADKNNLILLEALKTGFFPAFNKLLDEINKGVIGEIKEVKATFTKLISDHTLREWQYPYGGATLELASYPLLLAQKILGTPNNIDFYPQEKNKIDSSNRIVCQYESGAISISTVAIGMKSEGDAVISGTEGYIYIPAPWWLTKTFIVRFEDNHKEYSFNYELEGDGLRYEISEFVSLITRKRTVSNRITHHDMLNINNILSKFFNLKGYIDEVDRNK